jgi:hypothetical protein
VAGAPRRPILFIACKEMSFTMARTYAMMIRS